MKFRANLLQLLILFLTDAQGQSKYEMKQSHAAYFRQHFTRRTLSSLTSEDITRSIPTHNQNTGRLLTPVTQNRYRSSIMWILSLAYKSGWIDKIPFVVHKKEPKIRIKWITKDQASRLIQALRLQWMKEVCSFALFTGARMSKILTLKWENINFSKRIAIVTCDKSKSGKSRALPLNHNAIKLLKTRQKNSHDFVFVRTSTNKPISDIDLTRFCGRLPKNRRA